MKRASQVYKSGIYVFAVVGNREISIGEALEESGYTLVPRDGSPLTSNPDPSLDACLNEIDLDIEGIRENIESILDEIRSLRSACSYCPSAQDVSGIDPFPCQEMEAEIENVEEDLDDIENQVVRIRKERGS